MYLEIDGWKTGLSFAASHFIPGHPKCGRLHGHSYAVHLRIHGEPDHDGLILDFTQIKHQIRPMLERFDHRVLIPAANPALEITVDDDDYQVSDGHHTYRFPKGDAVMIEVPHTTVECLAGYLLHTLLSQLRIPAHVTEVELGLDEGPGQGAWVGERFERDPAPVADHSG